MKKLFGFVVVLLALSAPVFLNVAQAKDRNKEESFVGKTIINARFEVESSKLALKKSKNKKIRAFAEKIIADHSRMNDDLQGVLARTGIGAMISFQELDDAHQDKLEDLGQSSPTHFDEDYTDAQIVEHDEAITLFEDYISEGKNAALKSFAGTQLPIFQTNETTIKGIEKSL